MIARRLIVLTQLLLVAHLTAPLVAAQDAVPALIQVSGELIDQRGKPLTGQQTVMFALYKEQSDKAPLWVESQVVAADAKGRFIALLGATSPTGLPVDLFSTGQARWLGMQAAGQAEQPRSFLASVPYALAPLSALSNDSKTGETAATNQPAATSTQSTTLLAPSAAAAQGGPPASPVFTVVADATSGLTSTPSPNGATVTLTLIRSCATGQLLKWNGTAWGCTADTDVRIGVTGGGLNVLANATSPNVVGGFGGNSVPSGAVGATIAGGGESRPDGGLCAPFPAPCRANNSVVQSFGTVGGGEDNQAGDSAGAAASRSFATVGGGHSNTASGQYSTIPGGYQNAAAGMYSFAAGRNAKANHPGSFVWGDNSSTDAFASTAPNQFVIRAAGGVRVRGPFNLDDSTNNGAGVLQFPTGAGLFFRSGADNASYVDRMFISGSTGRVGIGTTTPTTMLDVRGHLNLQDSGNNGVLAFPSSGGGLFLRSGVDNVNYADRMFISGATGRVGIGTTDPAQMLDVAGSVKGNALCIGLDCRSVWPNGGSGGGLEGSGSDNHLARWLNGQLGDSHISDSEFAIKIQLPVNGGGINILQVSTLNSPAIVSGNANNNIDIFHADGATIAGGGMFALPNSVTRNFGAVGGGFANSAGEQAVVAGGSLNTASGFGSTVPGGAHNVASGDFSFAAGRAANAQHLGSFVWAGVTDASFPDDRSGPFASSGPGQFLIRAAGGVGITRGANAVTTYTPTEALDVDGNVKANGLCIGSDCRTAWPSGSGTIIGVTAGAGLTGGGTSGNVTLKIAPADVTNAMLQNSAVSVNAGTGLSGGGTVALGGSNTLSVDYAATQQRVSGTCDSGRAIDIVHQDGSVHCQTVIGSGLTGTGNVNFLTKFTGPGTLGSGTVFDDGNNVGIGTTTPSVKLDVAGAVKVTASPSTVSSLFVGALTATNPADFGSGIVGITSGIENGTTGVLGFASAESTSGSQTFGQTLGVSGISAAPNGIGVAGSAAQPSGANVGVFGQTVSPDGMGGAFQNANPNGVSLSALGPVGDPVFSVFANGKTGIGTNAPTEILDVNGNVRATKFIGDGSMLTNLPSGGGGTITGVTANGGLTGGGTSGSVSLAIANNGVTNAMLQNSAVTLTTPAGSGLTGGGSVALGPFGGSSGLTLSILSGGVTNAMLQHSSIDLNLSPISGLTGGGTIALGSAAPLSVDFATTQKRLSNNCAGGSAIQSVSQDGTVVCVPVGSSGIGGAGAPDNIPKFLAGGVTVGDSRISDNGTDTKLGDDASGRFSVLGNGISPNIVGGYKDNSVSAGGVGGTIAGGGVLSAPNVVTAPFGVVGGGLANSAGNGGVVAGGNHNNVAGDYGTIGGGRDNRASGAYSTVPGGRQNIASGMMSFAAGSGAQAAHDSTFVWADQSAPGGFMSTDINQFLIRAQNGVGIGTPSPTQALDVAGNIKANGLCIGTDCRSTWPSGGGTITGVTAGGGLVGGGTSGNVDVSVDFGATQKRVTGSCSSGIQSVNGDGTVACASGGGVTGAGTMNKVPRFAGTTVLSDSQISDDGLNVTIGVTGGGLRVLANSTSPNIVAGFGSNIANGVVGATIGGGGNAPLPNKVTGDYGTVGGGFDNHAGDLAAVTDVQSTTVGGGDSNIADGTDATVGGGHGNHAGPGVGVTVSGGQNNTASAAYGTISGGDFNTLSGGGAMIPGGFSNSAAGVHSFAAGRQAKANHDGAFVWADNLATDFASTAANQFAIRATGGTRIFSNAALTAGVSLAANASAWSTVSDRNLKENFIAVNGQALLDKLNAISVNNWNYKAQDASIRHMGPTAQDFYAAFGLGEDNTHISTVDADGVALAGVKALYQLLLEKNEELVRQQSELRKMRGDLDSLQEIVNELLARATRAPR